MDYTRDCCFAVVNPRNGARFSTCPILKKLDFSAGEHKSLAGKNMRMGDSRVAEAAITDDLHRLISRLQATGFINKALGHIRIGAFELEMLIREWETATIEDRAGVERLIHLPDNEWSKWYFTDIEGIPILICASKRK